MRLDGREDIQSVKSSLSILHLELKAGTLPHLEKRKEVKQTRTHTHFLMNSTGDEILFFVKMLDICIFWGNKLHKSVSSTYFGYQCIGNKRTRN